MPPFKAIMLDYESNLEHYKAENAWWSDQELSLEDAILRAGDSKLPRNKYLDEYGNSKPNCVEDDEWLMMHSHQCRLGAVTCAEGGQALVHRKDDLRNAQIWDEIHEITWQVAQSVPWLGRLWAYDVAERIGLRLGKEPDKIYLHAGVREGAQNLKIEGADGPYILVTDLPEELRSLSASEAETILCIYKECFVCKKVSEDSESLCCTSKGKCGGQSTGKIC